MFMIKIVNVIPKDDYTLTIELNNQECLLYNMKPRLQTVRFGELIDLDLFKKISINNENTIVWNEQCQITIDEIIDRMKR